MKKILISIFSVALTIILLPINPVHVLAEETTEEPTYNTDGYEIVTLEQMEYELGEESPYVGKYITYGIDDEGNYIRISVKDALNTATNKSNGPRKSVIATSTIAIFIGSAFVGYLTGTVIDGIVIAATGQSGGEWVAQAIQAVLNKPYSSQITIPKSTVCSGYPMYGWKPDYCR